MPSAARQGDPGVVHCSGYVIASGSPDVFVNGLPVARVGDPSISHLGSGCVNHTSTIIVGSPNVFVNGRPLARVGDALSACTQIAQGSPDVKVN